MARKRSSTANDHQERFEFPRGWLARFRRELVGWYAAQARPLPWRASRDPYAIWISEVMLQQTTVAAVVPYFERFLARFPTVQSLAEAPEQELLRVWEGLGYYSRARNLQRAARTIVAPEAEGGLAGQFPQTVEGWTALPGIGRYTAGAIVGFAFDTPAPIVEANTLRLYARLMGYADDPRSARGQRLLWDFAERIVPQESPGQFNQALMELGSLVCRPVDPDCRDCPVNSCCRALAEGTQAEIPLAAKRPVITDLVEHAVVIERDDSCLLWRWNPGERWAGLWDFARFGAEHLPAAESASRTDLAEAVRKALGLAVDVGDCFHELTHGVTRYRIRLRAWRARPLSDGTKTAKNRTPLTSTRETLWVPIAELGDYPLSVSARKVATVLTKRSRGLFDKAW